jgi:hypothetical protein
MQPQAGRSDRGPIKAVEARTPQDVRKWDGGVDGVDRVEWMGRRRWSRTVVSRPRNRAGRAPCPHWPPCCLHYERSFYPPPATNLSFDAIHRQWILVQRPKVCLDCTPPRTRGRWKWWVPASGDAQPTVRLAANAFLVPTSPLGAATTAAPSNACTQIVRTRSSIMHMCI